MPAGRYEPAPPPREAALEGSQFIRCTDDAWVQVRTEDGKLLGAIPAFPADVDRVFTQARQELSVGMIAVRAVVVPYNAGVDPFAIQGFVPGPGVVRGPLSTGAVGLNANLDNPDIGRRV